MKEIKYTIDMLTTESVSILTQEIITIEEKEFELSSFRKAYMNHEQGRNELNNELPENISKAVLAIWDNG